MTGEFAECQATAEYPPPPRPEYEQGLSPESSNPTGGRSLVPSLISQTALAGETDVGGGGGEHIPSGVVNHDALPIRQMLELRWRTEA